MFKKWVTMMVLVGLVLSTAALASAKDGTKELQAEEERAISVFEILHLRFQSRCAISKAIWKRSKIVRG